MRAEAPDHSPSARVRERVEVTLSVDGFYENVPVIDSFDRIVEPEPYTPLPEGWVLGLADVVASRRAIAAGNYKAVNVAGAAIIAAMTNAMRGRDFPFVFGGDGASFAVAGKDAELAKEALAKTAAWVRDETELTLRVALVPVRAVRERGLDVEIARFAASPNVHYAMFAGGGLAWAEQVMKDGPFTLAAAPRGERPDLSGLSCRWEPVPTERGVTLSLIVTPGPTTDATKFRALIRAVLAAVSEAGETARPVRPETLKVRWPPRGFNLEARARYRKKRLWGERVRLVGATLLSFLLFRSGQQVGTFEPERYVREMVENADFRKYHDGLRMTVDCAPAFVERLEAILAEAASRGIITYGLHQQDAAIITCITTNPYRRRPSALHRWKCWWLRCGGERA